MKTGLILASGYGSRLRKYFSIPKYFINIRDYPLIYYPYYSLLNSGIRRIGIIFNEETFKFFSQIKEYFTDVELSVLVNPRPELDNGYTLLYGLYMLNSYPVLVSVSDHIYPPHVITEMTSNLGYFDDADFIVAGDRKPLYVDVSEATKILVRDGFITYIGKDLQDFSYIDMGIFIFKESFKKYVDISINQPITISQLLNKVISEGGRGQVYVFEGLPWKDVDTLEDYNLVSSEFFDKVFKPYFNL